MPALFSLGQHPAPGCAGPAAKMGNVFSLSWTTGRLKCGPEEVWLHWALRCCRQWQESTTQMRLCGEAIPLCAGKIKACGFWAHHCDTQTLFVPPSCLCCLRHMTSCSRRSSPFKISSVLGCSFFTVAVLGQTTPSEWSTPS